MNNACNIAILRPTATSLEKRCAGNADPSARIESEGLDAIVAAMRSLPEAAADDLGKVTNIQEFQLHEREGRPRVLSTKRSKAVTKHELLVAIDPDPMEFGYIQKAIDILPLGRGLIGFLSADRRERVACLLAQKRTMAIAKNGNAIVFQKIPQLFAMALPLNGAEQADHYDMNVAIAKQALLYPDIPGLCSARGDFLDLKILHSDQYESRSSFRRDLVGDEHA